MKKSIIISVLAMLLIVLSGCGDIDNAGTHTNGTSQNTANTTNTAVKNTTSNKTDVTKYDFLAAAKEQVSTDVNDGETIAIMHVKGYGDIKFKFFNNIAPKAVENFVKHSQEGYYNGTTFHRVMNDFMIQGGDPTATGRGGESIWGSKFEDEFDYSLVPYRGALCMANAGSNTNGSQFFIEQAKYNEKTYDMLKSYGYPQNLLDAYKVYGGSMHLFCKHTVFGQVIEGMDVVDKIAAVKTDENDKPLQNVVIESIEITQK